MNPRQIYYYAAGMYGILSEVIIIALLEHIDAPTSLALICAAKFLQPYIKYIDHVKKLCIGHSGAFIITYSGKFLSLTNIYEITNIHHNGDDYKSFVEFVKQQKLIIRKVSCGERHIAAITSSGKLITWGDNSYGQCSLPDKYKSNNEITFRKVNCEGFSTAAVTTSGELVLFGEDSEFLDMILETGETFHKVKCGLLYIIAITSAGKLLAWDKYRHSRVALPFTKGTLFRKISNYNDDISAITTLNKLILFGNQRAMLCNIQNVNEVAFRTINHGIHMFAITTNGESVVWGNCSGSFRGIQYSCESYYLSFARRNFRKIKSSNMCVIALTSSGDLLMNCRTFIFDGGTNITAQVKKLIKKCG